MGSQQLPGRQAFLSGAEPRLTIARKGMCPHLARTSFTPMFLFINFLFFITWADRTSDVYAFYCFFFPMKPMFLLLLFLT